MKKKFISILSAIAFVAGTITPVMAAARPNVSEDFESFSGDSPWTAPAAGYAIKSDTSKYLAVPSSTAESSAPVLNVNYGANMTLEFDAKTDSTCVMIFAKFEGGGYYSFFQTLVDGRGPLVREGDSSPYFFYDSGAAKPNYKEWHNYRIDFDYSDHTLKAFVDGREISKFYDRSYSVSTPTFPEKKLESLRFFVDTTKTGDACYDNVRLYTEDSGSDEITFSDDYYKEAYLKLNALDGITDTVSEYAMEEILTRGEFTELVMQTLGLNSIKPTDVFYNDVPITHPQAGAINTAARMGYVAPAEEFRPDDEISYREAATIICNINNYNVTADLNGGWPNGYVNMAHQYKIDEHINVLNIRQLMNMKDSVILIANALTAPNLRLTVMGGGQAKYEEDKDDTILYRFHGLREVDCFVDEYDKNLNQATVTERKTSASYTANYTSADADVENTMQYVWIDKNNENIKYMYPFRNSTVAYGYINTVNDDEDKTYYRAGDIKRVESSTCIKTKLDRDAVITLNGSEISGTVAPVGMYSRIVVINDAISRIDLFDMTPGGLIDSAAQDKIIFTNGVSGYSVIDNIDAEKPPRVILDNKQSNIKSLKADMYFDYTWIGNEFMIAASSLKVSGVLSSVGAERMSIITETDTLHMGVDLKRLYISTDEGSDYSSPDPASSFLNGNVTVYADANGTVRYMKAEDTSTFYGAVVRYNDDLEETENPTLTVACIGPNNVTEREYEVKLSKNTLYYPEVGYYEAAENAKKTDGSGIYKFTVKNGFIKKIEALEWFNDGPVSIGDEFFGGDDRLPRIKVDRNYYGFNQNMIVTLVNGRNEFEVSKISWSGLAGMAANAGGALLEGSKPVGELLVLLDYNTAYFSTQFGFIQSIEEVYGDDDEIHLQYTISKRGSVDKRDVLAESPMVYGSSATPVKEYDFVFFKELLNKKYTSGALQTAKSNSLNDFQAFSMSGTWEEGVKGIIALVHLGTFKGITNGYIKASLAGEDTYMLLDSSGYDIFKTNKSHSRFSAATLSDIPGKDIWVITLRDKTLAIFYEE